MLDWKEKITLPHYTELFEALDPVEAAERCGFKWNPAEKTFAFRYMGEDYTIAHPSTEISPDTLSVTEKLLVLRCLCVGLLARYRDVSFSFREIPWGDLYYKVFEARCLKRLAQVFGKRSEDLPLVLESIPNLNAKRVSKYSFTYRFEFISNLSMSFTLWPSDNEFSARAQILFDNNVPAMFSAEDLTVLCEAVIKRLTERLPEK